MVEDSGQAGASLSQTSKPLGDVIDRADLFVERHQDVFARDWSDTAKNYADGKLVIYARLRCNGAEGEQHHLSLLIAEHMVRVGWPRVHAVNEERARGVGHNTEAMGKIRVGGNQILPVLVGVGDFVHGPEGVIPSGVWALGFDEAPLSRSEFLFQTVFPNHSFGWEWLGLPGLPVDAAEGEPYARRAAPIKFGQAHDGLIKGGAEPTDDLNHIEGYIDGQIGLTACDYVRAMRLTLDSNRIGVGGKVPVDGPFELVKLALSSFDVFT